MNPQSARLRKTIFAACKELGIDQETRRDLQLVTTGKSSMSNMTQADMEAMVGALEERGFKSSFKPGAKGRKHPAAPRKDLAYVHVLWGLLGKAGKLDRPDRAGLNAFIRKRFGDTWQAVPGDVDMLRDAAKISAVIRALKSWCKREGIQTERKR